MNRSVQRGGKSKYKGVGYDGRGGRNCWMSYVNLDGRRWYLGRYDTEEEAAWMYDQWAVVLHGEYARLNFEYQ